MTISVTAKKREKKGSLEGLRKTGIFPAVFYGKKQETTPIEMPYSEFLKIWKKAGESSVISIKLPASTQGEPDESVDALIHDVQFDPVSGNPVHADFYVFEKGHKLEISVPLEFIGESPAVKAGAVLVKVLHELKIKADPTNIPHQLEVDISALSNIGDHVSAGSIKLPAGVELMENPEEMVVSAVEAKEEVIEETPVDLSAIEVEKKGKKEEVEGGEAETPDKETSS